MKSLRALTEVNWSQTLSTPSALALQKAHNQGNSGLQLLSKELDSGPRNLTQVTGAMVAMVIACNYSTLCCMSRILTHFYRIMKKSLTAIYGLTSRGACPLLSLGSGTGMFLADLKALIDASSAPDGITAHEFDARAEGVLKVCDQFASVSALKDFIRSCLRAELGAP